uniref:Merozoite surface antigen n=1 Tax=Sarcocystis neurona TaxID=42890 RepID=Q86M54_SARNE|nr:putative surface antigen protein 5 [Sarcocystis neurona]AAO91776.1 merozoite surface antigen [Sarcocystis neurona]
MTRAMLLTILTLCSARVSFVNAGGARQATCEEGQTTATKLENPGVLQLQCPARYQLNPAPAADANEGMQVFTTAAVGNAVALQGVLPGATYVRAPNGAGATLTIPQLPPKAASVFIQCQQQGQQGQCFIEVQVAGSPRLGPNTCAAVQSRIDFEIRAQNEAAVFSCGAGRAPFPQALDDACSKEQSLPSGVALAPKDAGSFQLGFPQLPQNPLKICYICTEGGQRVDAADQRCEVHIAVAGAEAGGPTGPTGGASVGPAARSASALVLAVVAAGFFHFW